MRRAAIFFVLLFILAFMSSCAANTTHAKQVDGIPLLLTLSKDSKKDNSAASDQDFLSHWNIKTGVVSIEDNPMPLDKLTSDPSFRKFLRTTGVTNENGSLNIYGHSSGEDLEMATTSRDKIDVGIGKVGERGNLFTLKVPVPSNTTTMRPLLVSGSPSSFILLIGYNDPSRGDPSGVLLLGSYKDSHMQWREVKGSYPSFSTGSSPDDMLDAIKVGSKIYINEKSASTVKAIDLTSEPLELVDYAPANDLIHQIAGQEPSPSLFGSYQGTLLVLAAGYDKSWVCALQNDKNVGRICVDIQKRTLTSYKDNKVVDRKHLPEEPSGIQLPR